jgi:REP element-mobilizing transposase RayT
MPGHPVRKRARLPGYDYASPGAYFITVCTHQRHSLFGEIVGGPMCLNAFGAPVQAAWLEIPRHFPEVEIGALVVMPNHLHAIVILNASVGAKHPDLSDASPLPAPSWPRGTQARSIPAIVQKAKSISSRRINLLRGTPGRPVWLRGYFEHVVRSPRELDRLRRYFESNPLLWELDRKDPGNM